MRLTYGVRAPSLWQDNPAGTNGARPGAAALMTLLELFRTLVEINTHWTCSVMFDLWGFGMMRVAIVRTVWAFSRFVHSSVFLASFHAISVTF